MNKLNNLVDLIDSADSEPDIIAVVEVKPKHCRFHLQESELQIANYGLIPNLPPDHIRRGIAIYYHIGINISEVKPSTAFSESIWIKLKLGTRNVLLGCVY